ncbi:PREDICTED: CISIN_1g0418261mg [Prunus dulcis]|uniref:PREDICTED: CISIN_1g0418261mg n=1 Tax=Prunus dulcis TaxID=3755 RepID=A0A5E4GDD0_PRUDU|nr:PREDICTED: CISIN_1g0418261mg [Prunus dulcis]
MGSCHQCGQFLILWLFGKVALGAEAEVFRQVPLGRELSVCQAARLKTSWKRQAVLQLCWRGGCFSGQLAVAECFLGRLGESPNSPEKGLACLGYRKRCGRVSDARDAWVFIASVMMRSPGNRSGWDIWGRIDWETLGICATCRDPEVVERRMRVGSKSERGDANVERDPDAEAGDAKAEVEDGRDAEDPDCSRVDLDGVPVKVSMARGVGEASCSYRQGVPMHLYFYEEGEWLTDTAPMRMTHELLERIRPEYEVPRDVVLSLPQPDDRSSQPPRGWVMLYWEMFKNGLRSPLHPFVQ